MPAIRMSEEYSPVLAGLYFFAIMSREMGIVYRI